MLTSAKLIFWITFDWLNFRCWNFPQSRTSWICTFRIKNFFEILLTSAEISKKHIFAKICWRQQNFKIKFVSKFAYSWSPTLGKISASKVETIDANVEAEPRPIHVKFTNWKDAEYFKSVIISYNKKLLSRGKKPSVFVDNMYSDFTNQRRKLAWNERKSLKDSGLKAPMYIKYPATLMVKNNETGKFQEHSVF